jgi:hypothetical protein
MGATLLQVVLGSEVEIGTATAFIVDCVGHR